MIGFTVGVVGAGSFKLLNITAPLGTVGVEVEDAMTFVGPLVALAERTVGRSGAASKSRERANAGCSIGIVDAIRAGDGSGVLAAAV